MIFEKLDGGTLLHNIWCRGLLSEHDVSEVVKDIADGLYFLHQKGRTVMANFWWFHWRASVRRAVPLASGVQWWLKKGWGQASTLGQWSVLSVSFSASAWPGDRKYMWPVKTTQQRPFYGPLSGTTRVSRYQKKHSPTTNPDHHPIFISFFHLPRSIASSLFKLRAWQSSCTTSFHVLLWPVKTCAVYSLRVSEMCFDSFYEGSWHSVTCLCGKCC